MPLAIRFAVIPRAVLLLIALALLAVLAAGAVGVGSTLHLGLDSGGPRFALPPTSCAAGTTLKSGDIATVAGNGKSGSSGDAGPATAASLNLVPEGGGDVAVDPSGVIYISDPGQPPHPTRRH